MKSFLELNDLLSSTQNSLTEVDFTNADSVKEYKNTIQTIKDMYNELKSSTIGKLFGSVFIGDIDVENICDTLMKQADEKYAENKQKETPTRPSTTVDENILRRVTELATEYVDTMIKPYTDLNDEQKKSVYECLVEYSCWMYNHK